MNDRTDAQRTRLMPEFSNRFVYILIAAACATLLSVFGARMLWHNVFLHDFLAKPEAIAAQLTVEHGIDEFQGLPLTDTPPTRKWTMISSIFLSFVLAPLGLLLGWRSILLRHSQNQEVDKEKKKHWPTMLIVIVSGILVGHVLIINLSGAIMTPMMFRTMILDNEVDQNRSYICSELGTANMKAFQYYYLPVEIGGGGRSFRSNLPASKGQWVSLEELGVPTTTSVAAYHINKIENDTIMVIRGVSNFRLSDGTYPEYELRVCPSLESPEQNGTLAKIN